MRRYVLLVEDLHGGDWWLELRETQRAFLEEANDAKDGVAGAVFDVSRLCQGAVSRVVCRLVGRVEVAPVDISAFVASLGLPPLTVGPH